jgi:hypothetical protein
MVWGKIHYNAIATRKAANLCSSISIGEPTSEVVAKAEKAVPHFLNPPPGPKYRFLFPGFMFDYAVCEVVIENGSVKSKSIEEVHD